MPLFVRMAKNQKGQKQLHFEKMRLETKRKKRSLSLYLFFIH